MAAEVFEKRRGAPVDPMAHGGHAETDLAVLQLFGYPYLDEALAGYNEARRLPRAGASTCACTSWLPCCSTGHISFRMICHIARNVTNHPEGNVTASVEAPAPRRRPATRAPSR